MRVGADVLIMAGIIFCAQAGSVSAQTPDYVDHRLESCFDDQLEVRFDCHPDWEVHFNDQSDIFVISEDPAVLLTIARRETDFKSLEQLTPGVLEEFAQYADGFRTERVSIDGIPAIRVKAFDRTYPQIRLADHYFLKDGYLYMIFFSVTPRKAWDDYRYLLRDVLQSFQFEPLPE
ncbi:MAG: hypothetical protein ACLFPX_07025 [Candidatus Omnitrophota bacterium]